VVYQCSWVGSELGTLSIAVDFGGCSSIAGQDAKPDTSSDKDIQVLCVGLKTGYGLYGGCTGSDYSYAIVFPLFWLVVVGPAGCVDDSPFEFAV
jgi:hypothetical protein